MGSSSKAARSPKDVTPARRRALEEGLQPASNLAEGLAIDFSKLMAAAFPKLAPAVIEEMRAASSEGVTRRMALAGKLLFSALGKDGVDRCLGSTSDTVRGFGAYVLAQRSTLSLRSLLKEVRPFADDPHFAVREWAWIAIRPRIVREPEEAVLRFQAWTSDDHEFIRRFAVESTRPRGVWCPHLPLFKTDPQKAVSLLEPLRADPVRYVQDSVANWLNDASKSQPQWVLDLTERWSAESSTPHTQRICHRALRSLRKAKEA